MTIANEIASITILSSYHRGTELINQIIPFKVFREDQKFIAVPLINAEERKLVGLSEEISFKIMDHNIASAAEMNRGDQDAITNIVRELRMLRIV